MVYALAYTKVSLLSVKIHNILFSSFVHSFNYTIFNPRKACSPTAEETEKL